ncbi:hypothetical protein RHSIM_Rhsim03G0133900 [Rhododendron simsii]|uniref:PPM-type phosphatase domain-containing protein n=1 Tax=Rhododendron simsii TaxID=118357 RepID=A0A834LQX6_RHOSS|nr:hypothetical protein RHSIM_Rhsim03G0133900 [Rhododendron simsii]
MRRRRMEIPPFKLLAADVAPENGRKWQKVEEVVRAREFENAVDISLISKGQLAENGEFETKPIWQIEPIEVVQDQEYGPKFGMTSVCGRRRDMEDAVAIHPSYCRNRRKYDDLNFYGVYDAHDSERGGGRKRRASWKETMERSFSRMDKEVTEWCSDGGAGVSRSNCRCELRTPQCDAVGSTAVVAVVTPDKIVVSNCGDSRAVLCRNGVAIPLSSDHNKPNRPDELERIENAGGRVIYWDGARVLGVLAMSRAIGDKLFEAVCNTGTGDATVAAAISGERSQPDAAGESSNKACSDASLLLTKLALARHSTDNISVVVVDLRRVVEALQRHMNLSEEHALGLTVGSTTLGAPHGMADAAVVLDY